MADSIERSPLTNPELLALAEETGNLSTWQLAAVGSLLDERRKSAIDELRATVMSGLVPDVEAVREQARLALARYSVDASYGRRTGRARKGCSMGAPVSYHP